MLYGSVKHKLYLKWRPVLVNNPLVSLMEEASWIGGETAETSPLAYNIAP